MISGATKSESGRPAAVGRGGGTAVIVAEEGLFAGPGCSSGAHRSTGGDICDCDCAWVWAWAWSGAVVLDCALDGRDRVIGVRLRFWSGEVVLGELDNKVGIEGGGTAVSVRADDAGGKTGV